jgi:hypothetical protein
MKKVIRATPEQVKAGIAVFSAMVLVDTLRPIVEGYQARILTEIGCSHVSVKNSYLLPDQAFASFIARCHEERDLAGLPVDNPDQCPLLVAQHALVKAEHALVDVMEPVTGLSFDQLMCSRNGLENLREYVDLTLRLLAPYCKRGM